MPDIIVSTAHKVIGATACHTAKDRTGAWGGPADIAWHLGAILSRANADCTSTDAYTGSITNAGCKIFRINELATDAHFIDGRQRCRVNPNGLGGSHIGGGILFPVSTYGTKLGL
jgi:hypothetical protein